MHPEIIGREICRIIGDMEARLDHIPPGPEADRMREALEEMRRIAVRRLVEMDLGE